MKRTAVDWVDVAIEGVMYFGAALYFGAQLAKRVRAQSRGESDIMLFEPEKILRLEGTKMKKK